MRVIAALGISALVCLSHACKGEESKSQTQPAQPADPPATHEPEPARMAQPSPCPQGSDEPSVVRLGGATSEPRVVPGGIAWPEGRTLWFLADDADKPRTIRPEELEKLAPKPTRYLKRRCGARGCGKHGGNVDLVLIDGTTERIVASNQSEIGAAELVGDDVVWATFGAYGASGGVYRAPVAGGRDRKIWDGAITMLLVDKQDVYAAGRSGVAWIDLGSNNTVMLDKTSTETRSMALGTDRIFWADVGDPYHASKPSGRILSAPRHGGGLTTHATEQPWPVAIAVDDRRVYWGSRDRGGVWFVEIAGGPVSTLIPTDHKCGGVLWLHRTAHGLLFLRGDSIGFSFGGGGEVWMMSF